MYLTSGAKVRTRRSRTARSSVRRYSFQSASVSSDGEAALGGLCGGEAHTTGLLGAGGRWRYRDGAEPSASPLSGIWGVDMRPEAPSPLLGRGPVEPPSNALKPVHGCPKPLDTHTRVGVRTGVPARRLTSVSTRIANGRTNGVATPPSPSSPSKEPSAPMALRLVAPVDGPAPQTSAPSTGAAAVAQVTNRAATLLAAHDLAGWRALVDRRRAAERPQRPLPARGAC